MSRYREHEIAVEAVKVIEEYGQMDMTALIAELIVRMKPDGHDAEIIQNRNDSYFSQKVRNLRSHRNKIFFHNVEYEEDSKLYVARAFLRDTQSKPDVAKKSALRKRREKTTQFYARKADFESINAERKRIGNIGELLVYNAQKDNVKTFSPDLVKEVKYVARDEGDGAGYDILSFSEQLQVMYIEVKSTVGAKETPFYMSSTEYAFYELHKDNYYIARVYELDVESGKGKIEYIRGTDVDTVFEKEASVYRMFYKK